MPFRTHIGCFAVIVCLFFVLSPQGVFAEEKCGDWMARVESVQGAVVAQKAGQVKWVQVSMGDTLCPGDRLQVPAHGRAALFLRTGAVARLDQNTAITLVKIEDGKRSIIDVLSGIALFFSRNPFSLKVNTPFVNADVEGTEFMVVVETGRASISVFEGKLSASNPGGNVSVRKGQTVFSDQGRAPAMEVTVKPRDAVQWAVYYPPLPEIASDVVLSHQGSGWQGAVSASVEAFRKGDMAAAFDAIETVPDGENPAMHTYRALLLLAVGRADEASVQLDRALSIDPRDSRAFALQSIMEVARNRQDLALDLARKAVNADPASSSALIALSYAQQARFDLKGALESAGKAVGADPADAYAWARLSELRLSFGYLDKALDAAQQAVLHNPGLARTQTVLGFACLTQVRLDEAREAFQKAIRLDQADPLPRLGLGLAIIRGGNLAEGRWQIEIAAILDPGNSLIRSYLGKAYFDEKNDAQATIQFDQAKELDPLDPTPWFYGAIQKETQNRPVEALDQLEQSIRLNDNRAVYRSRLMLDQDLAAKSASLARIYQDLGFDRRALVEGWKSLNADPSNHSAHRFLSDAYATMPRHDIARVSELLQSQLLQPLNVNPVQPLMGEKNLFLPTVSGPANPSFNEYNALFTRNRADLLLSGSAGEHGSLADEVIVSGLYGKYSASLGQFHYETDGTWNNGDIRRNLYNAFVQAMVTPNLSLLAEYRNSNFLSGELSRVFSPAADYGTRESRDADSARFGMRASLSPQSDLIAHFSYCDFEDDIHYPKLFDIRGLNGYSAYNAEAQYLYRSERFNATVGGGTMWISNDSTTSMVFDKVYTSSEKRHINNSIGYLYTNINWPGDFTWTLGLSGNAAHGVKPGVDRDQVNPKLGLTWHPFPGTTVRSAVFRTLVGPGVSPGIFSGETIEPTQVAGFNQYFDDAEGTRSWRYGVGIDQKFGSHFFGGVEFSQRDEEVLTESDNQIIDFNVKEKLARAYLYWTPHPWISLGPEYQFERIETPENLSINSMCELNTHRLILGASFFHPCGFFAQAKPTLVFQEGRFLEKVLPYPHPSQYSRDHSDFFVLDAVIGYRLPRRLGFISIEARNLFDRSFRYQEIDPFSTSFYPQRWILGRVTLFF